MRNMGTFLFVGYFNFRLFAMFCFILFLFCMYKSLRFMLFFSCTDSVDRLRAPERRIFQCAVSKDAAVDALKRNRAVTCLCLTCMK